MAFTLPDLPYAHDALASFGMSKETFEYHHDIHHKAYVDNGNKLIAGTEWETKTVEEIVVGTYNKTSVAQNGIFNNASQHWNHALFWEIMGPGKGGAPVGTLAEAITKTFGSYDEFKAKFEAAGVGRFGSGFVWLIVNKQGQLEIISLPNQDSPYMDGNKPVIANDVWEHAYYLHYQNRRPDYLKAWWNVVNWDHAEQNYQTALKA
jgi:Fe-Mn family superoxide dismutase